MRKATGITAGLLGAAAGLAGVEHGIFEIMRGSTRPPGLVIASIGPPCQAGEAWNACEPALTIIPNYLISGILTGILGVLLLVWSVSFLGIESGGWIQILLSVFLLLFGGGFFPPLIGILTGTAATGITKPIRRQPGKALGFLSRLWPWPLIVFLAWVSGQWLVGYFWNDLLQRYMIYGVILILLSLGLSLFSAYARDVVVDSKEEIR